MIRWLDISGRHVILRPNQTGKEFPLIPVEYDAHRQPLDHRSGRLVLESIWLDLDLFCFLLAFESVESDPEANRASVMAGRQVERFPFVSVPAFRDGFSLNRSLVPCGLHVLPRSSRISSGNWHASRSSGSTPRSSWSG